jgi:hypothetical protein
MGQMDTMLLQRNCCEDTCGGAAITSLDHQAFCLNHFLLRCYERLEELDPRNRKFRAETANLAAMRAFIEECSRKALDVSLHHENLSNLERGRLLDILLWAGELFLLLRAPKTDLADDPTSADSLDSARAAASRL